MKKSILPDVKHFSLDSGERYNYMEPVVKDFEHVLFEGLRRRNSRGARRRPAKKCWQDFLTALNEQINVLFKDEPLRTRKVLDLQDVAARMGSAFCTKSGKVTVTLVLTGLEWDNQNPNKKMTFSIHEHEPVTMIFSVKHIYQK